MVVDLALGLGLAALVVAGSFVRHHFLLVRVAGASMEPTLHNGDRVLVHRIRPDRLRPGQVVVLASAPWIVKRVAAVPGDPVPSHPDHRVPPGSLFLLGDNHARSLDSRKLGYYPAATLLGVAFLVIGEIHPSLWCGFLSPMTQFGRAQRVGTPRQPP
jgi:signal peptidase I